MSRKSSATSRRTVLSDKETALQWELRRAREELSILRKARQPEPDDPEDGLSPAGIAVLVRKIGMMVRNSIPYYLSGVPPCPHCDGHSVAQIEAAFEAWADAEAGRVGAKAALD